MSDEASDQEFSDEDDISSEEPPPTPTPPEDIATREGVMILSFLRNGPEIRANPYRRDKEITAESLNPEAWIASGGFGSVYQVRNMKTGQLYALKSQDKRDDFEDEPPESGPDPNHPEGEGGPDKSPPMTATTYASIRSSNKEEMQNHHLYNKRFNETKAYLQYMKGGHRNICNLEAYADIYGYSEGVPTTDAISHIHIYELCNLGTLENLIKRYERKNEYIPEEFIWSAYMDMIEGLTWIQGAHPDYVGRPNYHGPTEIIGMDFKPNNVFLRLPPGYKEQGRFPVVKLADFGECIRLPPGGRQISSAGNIYCSPPEGNDKVKGTMLSNKFDVWIVASMIYAMTHDNTPPKIVKADNGTWGWIVPFVANPHYSRQLWRSTRMGLVRDMERRPNALQARNLLKPIVDPMNLAHLNQPLPDDISLHPLKVLDQNEVRELKRTDIWFTPFWTPDELVAEEAYYNQITTSEGAARLERLEKIREAEEIEHMRLQTFRRGNAVPRRKMRRRLKWRAYQVA